MKLHLALLKLFLKGIPSSFLSLGPKQQLSDQPAAVFAKFTASSAQHSRAHTKAGTLAPSQTLAVRKPQLSHNVKWAYKMPGEIAPRVDKPSNKQALGN